MNTKLIEGEAIKKQGGANLQRGWETVGGHLYLTNKRLIFESHSVNIQTGTSITSLTDIVSVTKCWTKFLNKYPLLPNSIRIETKAGNEYKFVCYNREKWISAINESVVK